MKKQLAALLLAILTLAGCSSAPDAASNDAGSDTAVIRVAALKGPTTMGMVKMIADNEGQYEFSLYTGADEIVPLLAKGETDIALLPANVAATLYQKTEGEVRVIGVNTLGVLSVVAADGAVQSIGDLQGKKLYMTGKGTTPEYVLRYVLEQNGLSMEQVTIDFKREAAEVVAALTQDPEAIGVLPQPFATVATTQNDTLKIAMQLGDFWEAADGSRQVTGVTVTRTGTPPAALDRFLADHAASTAYVNANPEEAAVLVEENGIVKAEIAQKAIPYCSIVSLSGDEMRQALKGYLDVLYALAPESVGGAAPDDAFYVTDPATLSGS